MVVKTQLTSPVAEKAQHGIMEFLLLNHPLDCPVCDKGGECPLQNQAMGNGHAECRFKDVKRTYEKPIAISSQVLLDRERCVLCARCTRFSQQIAGDPFIELFERGALEQVAIFDDEPFPSYFSGNTVQICPVGALTGTQYRFRARPFDLVSTPTVCEHCASGCQQRTDWRRGKVLRRLAGEDPDVNEEWNCDKGRWAFRYATARDRLTTPLVRDDDGYLVEASWTEAIARAAAGLAERATAAASACSPAGGSPSRTPTPTRSSRGSRSARTTSTSGPARTRRGAGVPRQPRRWSLPRDDVRRSGPRRPCCWSASSPRRSRRSSSCGCARRVDKAGLPVFVVAPFATDGPAKLGGRLLTAAARRRGRLLTALGTGPRPMTTSSRRPRRPEPVR